LRRRQAGEWREPRRWPLPARDAAGAHAIRHASRDAKRGNPKRGTKDALPVFRLVLAPTGTLQRCAFLGCDKAGDPLPAGTPAMPGLRLTRSGWNHA
jgi:hypothetical protein